MTDRTRQILEGMGGAANVCALCAVAALFLRQDFFLLLAIVIVLGGVGLLLWTIHSWMSQKISRVIIFFIGSVIVLAIPLVLLSNVKVKPVQIEIVEPKEGSQIEADRYLVKGTVGDPNATISLVVRPHAPLDYWVMESPTVDGSGNWQGNAHFGEKTVGIGDKYEVIALATNENFIVTWVTGNSLPTGMRPNLPSNTNRSNLVTVTRVR